MKLDANLVARGWVDLQSLNLNSEEYRAGSWAFEIVLDAMERDGRYVWEIIEQILVADQVGQFSEALAVGILDEFLSRYGSEFMNQVEAKIVRDANFRKALMSVNLPVGNQIRDRIRSAM